MGSVSSAIVGNAPVSNPFCRQDWADSVLIRHSLAKAPSGRCDKRGCTQRFCRTPQLRDPFAGQDARFLSLEPIAFLIAGSFGGMVSTKAGRPMATGDTL